MMPTSPEPEANPLARDPLAMEAGRANAHDEKVYLQGACCKPLGRTITSNMCSCIYAWIHM